MPVGFRLAHAAVSNAELNLRREHAILEEQQREVSLEISNAIAEMDRAYQLAQVNLNRRQAASEQMRATEAVYVTADDIQLPRLLDAWLDAQQRLADSDSEYYRSLAEHMMAIKQVHYAKGSLLDYNEVFLSEGPWPDCAYVNAAEHEHQRTPATDRFICRTPVVSQGPLPQNLSSPHSPAHDPTHIRPIPEELEPTPSESSYYADPPAPPLANRDLSPGRKPE